MKEFKVNKKEILITPRISSYKCYSDLDMIVLDSSMEYIRLIRAMRDEVGDEVGQ